MKIYTKTGDKGETSLFGGKRVLKNHLRIESYGSIDELNSFIGLLYSELNISEIKNNINYIQNILFVIGSELATPAEDLFLANGKSRIGKMIEQKDIDLLEQWIDQMEIHLLPLKNFILPTGDKTASLSHICRTITRRTERKVIELSEIETVRDELVVYLNRLSDYFFVLARYLNHSLGQDDIIWKPNE